jgi:hypothetical protein
MSILIITSLTTLRFRSAPGHRLPTARLTKLAQQAFMRMVDPAPLDTFEPSLERYLTVHSLLERRFDNNAVDRSASIGSLGRLAQEPLSVRHVASQKRLTAEALKRDGLQLHREVGGLRRTQHTLNAEDETVIG